MNEEDMKVVEAMGKYGGGFVRSLARLCYQADAENFKKIKETWSNYWEQYKKAIEI